MKINEGNKIISEFDGWIDQLQYHTSWDALIPVVEKIENLDDGYKFQICRKRVTIVEDHATELHVLVSKQETKIKSVWVAVIEFIQWYNQNKL